MDMERWFTPQIPSTYERPFTHEGNYLVVYNALASIVMVTPAIATIV